MRWLYRTSTSLYRKGLFAWYRLRARMQKKKIAHFLHIGKTGGTAIKHALGNRHRPRITKTHIIFSHPHAFSICDTKKGEQVFFIVRDPLDRFVSGFYSRKRKGQPRLYVEWSPAEKDAFTQFATPNALGRALSDEDSTIRSAAERAMQGIKHVSSSYWNWLDNEEMIQERRDDIIFVGRQTHLTEDFAVLKQRLSLPDSVQLPTSSVHTHKNPEQVDKQLDDIARKNLQKWYVDEYACLAYLKHVGLL